MPRTEGTEVCCIHSLVQLKTSYVSVVACASNTWEVESGAQGHCGLHKVLSQQPHTQKIEIESVGHDLKGFFLKVVLE